MTFRSLMSCVIIFGAAYAALTHESDGYEEKTARESAELLEHIPTQTFEFKPLHIRPSAGGDAGIIAID